MGFCVLHFDEFRVPQPPPPGAPRRRAAAPAPAAAPPPLRPSAFALTQLCAVVGGAVYVQRAAAAIRDGISEGLAASGVAAAAATTPQPPPPPPRSGRGGDALGVGVTPSRRSLDETLRRSLDGPIRRSLDVVVGGGAAAAPRGAQPRPSGAPASPASDWADAAEALRGGDIDAAGVGSRPQLHARLEAMLGSAGLAARFGVAAEPFAAFAADVEAAMAANPFHKCVRCAWCFCTVVSRRAASPPPRRRRSFEHCVNVSHACWRMLDTGRLVEGGVLNDLDAYALLLAAMCHDLEHPGHTNAFGAKRCDEHPWFRWSRSKCVC